MLPSEFIQYFDAGNIIFLVYHIYICIYISLASCVYKKWNVLYESIVRANANSSSPASIDHCLQKTGGNILSTGILNALSETFIHFVIISDMAGIWLTGIVNNYRCERSSALRSDPREEIFPLHITYFGPSNSIRHNAFEIFLRHGFSVKDIFKRNPLFARIITPTF